MTEGEIRQRVRAALLDKRGSELILSLIQEIANLNIRVELALRQIQALRSFESLQDHLIMVDTPNRADPRPVALKLDASQLFNPSDGFHNLEYTQTGEPYRWTGPGRAFSFNVFVSRARPLEMTLRAARLMEPELQSEFVLIADGELMNLEFAEEEEKWVARAVLPSRADLGATHLTFVLPSVGSPPDGTDTRALGIAFQELEIRPGADTADPLPALTPVSNGCAPHDPIVSGSLSTPPVSGRHRRARVSGAGRVADMKRVSD